MNRSAIVSLIFSLLLSACATTPAPTETTAPDKTEAAGGAIQPATPASTAAATPETQPVTSDIQTQTAPAESIYFERDQYIISSEYLPVVQQQAEILKQNGKQVTLEGNADERGSSEYNLALGDRRAQAVRKSLQFLGVPADHIKVISYGEERPRQTCHEETCWHENRRVDFRY